MINTCTFTDERKVRMAAKKQSRKTDAGKAVGKGEPPALLLGTDTGTAAADNSMEAP